MPSNFAIRDATVDDVNALLPMIYALAVDNNAEATITAAQLRENGFGDRPWFRTLVAECGARAIGYSVCYLTYNASFGTRFLHIHHLYVEPTHRRAGVGRGLIAALARAAIDADCTGLGLSVAAENCGAVAFYNSLGFQREHPPNPRFFIGHGEMQDMAMKRPTSS